MLKIGITGGIGSGKTTICKEFAKLGIPIYYADDRAKALMVENPTLIKKIKSIFGDLAYYKNGKLNRKHLSNIVFNDKEKLAQLNAVVHPAVAQDSLEWHEAQQAVPYTLKEAALLFESGSHKALDKVITVFAPKAIRIERVMKRDGVSEAAVLARMNKQMPESKKMSKADFIIYNDGVISLKDQVKLLHEVICNTALSTK